MVFISNSPPITENSIEGKPYIIVSSKGIANGLSDILNDGANFGPDTMLNATDPTQIGPPYTQTSGIQEAVNYTAAQGGGKILMKNGIYKVSKLFSSPSGVATFVSAIWLPYIPVGQEYLPIVIEGESATGFYQEGTLGTFSPPTNGVIIDATSIDPSNLPFPSILSADGVAISKFSQLIPVLKNITVRANNSYIKAFNFYNSANFIGIHLVADTPNPTLNPPEPVEDGSQTSVGIVMPYIGNYAMSYLLNSYVFNYYTGIQAGTHAYIDNAFIMSCYEGMLLQGGSHYHYVRALIQWCPVGIFVSGTVYANIIVDIEDAATSLGASSWQLLSEHLSGNTLYGTLELHEVLSGGGVVHNFTTSSSPTYKFRYLDGFLPAIDTPSVPTSGTAQQNTNPYDVKVYVNGGAMTEIQITIGSTAYPVYSNSTASAVYEGFTLPAGASITLTYTTAPTWTWLPA